MSWKEKFFITSCLTALVFFYFLWMGLEVRWVFRGNTNVFVQARAGTSGFPGGIKFDLENRWGLHRCKFWSGFDGKLEHVETDGKAVDPNGPDWPVWLQRFEELKLEATTGESPEATAGRGFIKASRKLGTFLFFISLPLSILP